MSVERLSERDEVPAGTTVAPVAAAQIDFREVLDAVGEGFYVVDRDWRFVYVNRHAGALWKRDPADLVGCAMEAVFPALRGSPVYRDIQRLAVTGEGGETEVISPITGRWIRLVVHPVAVGTAIAFRDITDRKRAEEALRESERALSTLVANLPGVAYRFANDRSWTAEYISEGIVEIVGCAAERFLPGGGVCYADFIDRRDRERVWEEVQSALAVGRRFQLIYRVLTVAGEEKWVWEQGQAVLRADGSLRALEGFITDVTAQKRTQDELHALNATLERRVAERTRQLADANASLLTRIAAQAQVARALQREKEFSQRVVDGSLDGIFAFDLELRYTVWNPAMERISGKPAAEILGRIPIEAFPNSSHLEDAERFRATLRGERVVVAESAFAIPETGRSGFYEATLVPLRAEDGVILGGLGFVRDITQRVQREAALRQSQKMEAVGQLTGGIAHDFNNLLTVVAGNLELVVEKFAHDPVVRRLLSAALRACARGERLTHQLLAFSRKQHLDPAPLELAVVLREIRDLLRRTVGEQISVVTEIAPDAGRAMADRNMLETAILNLALNARDAMPDGGRLTLSARAAERQGRRFVEVSARDTGTGMPPEIVARVFEPFFTTKPQGKGTGLGLSMVYGFVTQSGGDVEVTSAPGTGTTISLFLPRVEDENAGRGGADQRADAGVAE